MNKFIYTLLLLILHTIINSSDVHSQCNSVNSYGFASAPTPGNTVQINTCNFADEYATISAIISGNSYQITSDVVTDFITVREGSSGGPVVAFGTQPLNFTATSSGTYYVHFHANSSCGAQSACRTTSIIGISNGCINTTNSGFSVTAPPPGNSITVSTCHTANSYSTINSVVSGANYTVSSSNTNDWITIRQGSSNGALIASGASPLTWNSTIAGTYYVHVNTNSSCGTSASCRNVSIQRNTPSCTNTTLFGSVAAPTGGASVIITSCNYAGEYNEISSVTSSTNYISSSSVPTDYITVRQGSPTGAVIAAGTTPLSWTSTVPGLYYIHYNANASCLTESLCRTTTIQNQCSLPTPTAINATPTTVCPGLIVNLNATSIGNSIRWFTQANGGTSLGTSSSSANFIINPLTTTTYYAEAFNTSGCVSTSRASITVNVTAGPNPPTSVSASPTNVCPNTNANLSATSSGNSINWYTQATGGTSIGTSASNAFFTVTPLTSTTYYAEAITSSGCISTTRTAVTVNTSPSPAPPTNISASPALLCTSQISNLNATANASGFTGVYAPSNWTVSNPNGDVGTVDASSAPGSISISSGSTNSGSFSSVFYTVNITTTGTINFDWSYSTLDFSALFDYPQYAINGVIIGVIPGFSGAGATSQLGNSSINVTAGQTFSLIMTTSDNLGGVGTTVFTNFTGPGNGTNNVAWYTAPSGGTFLGSSASAANFPVTPIFTTTYYAQTNTGSGCSSTRVPVTVSVDLPANPNPISATPSSICPGESVNLNATSNGGSSGIVNGFTGYYDPSNWTISHTPLTDQGVVNTASAPNSIEITSSDGGNFGNHSVIFTITIQGNGNVTFNWDYNTSDVNGSGFDLPQYAINGVIVGNVPGFLAGGPTSQSGTATIPVSSGQTFSLLMTATDDILGSGTTIFSNFTAPSPGNNQIIWYTSPSGGTSIGTSANGDDFGVSPSTTTTYYAEALSVLGCNSASRIPVTVTVNSLSTTPVIGSLANSYCPNSNITLTAAGGISGTGSDIYWYTGPNGTGSLVGVGGSIIVAPSVNTTYYLRREGICNTTADEVGSIVLKNFIYAPNGTSTSDYCTDNTGWHHFYVGDDIILSLIGDLSGVGTVTATIMDNGAYYLDPGNNVSCIGEVQFEMERNWNIDYSGSLSGLYNVRYYFEPTEKSAVILAANNWITTYASCGYTYKYANPDGWFWFKNQGATYTAPDYDDDPTFIQLTNSGSGTTANGINYATMSGINNFSGGTGAVILIPTTLLPLEWLYFNGVNEGSINKLFWATTLEENTDKFEVQRSFDAVNFEKIGSVNASGNSNNPIQYFYDDKNPPSGLNYYRIKLINKDGSEDFTNVIALEAFQREENFSFYPNPADDLINYQFDSNLNEDISIEIIDVLGRRIINRKFSITKGNNSISLKLEELLPGSYTIKALHSSGKANSSKFIKK